MAANKSVKRTTTRKSFGREVYGDVKDTVKEHPFISLLVGYKVFDILTKKKPVKTDSKIEEKSLLDRAEDKIAQDTTLVMIATIGLVGWLYKNL